MFCNIFSVEPAAPAYFAKVRKTGTLFVEENFQHIDMHNGVFIDVFPYDYVPKEKKKQQWYNARVKIWYQLFTAKTLWTTAKHVVPVWYKRYIVNICRSLLHILLFPVKKAFLFKQLDRALRRYSDRETEFISDRGGVTPACSREDYIPVKMHAFENIQVAIPNNFDKILRAYYGNYMQLPPENKRVSHAPVKLLLEKKESSSIL